MAFSTQRLTATTSQYLCDLSFLFSEELSSILTLIVGCVQNVNILMHLRRLSRRNFLNDWRFCLIKQVDGKISQNISHWIFVFHTKRLLTYL